MSTTAQRPQPPPLTSNGGDPYEKLSTTVIATGCQAFADLHELTRKGWKDPSLDAHFQNLKRMSAQPSTVETAGSWCKTYCKSMHNMNRQMKFIPDGPFNFLDLGCAPGGYSKCILETNPRSVGTGVCLPVQDGGYLFMLPKYMRARYTVHYADMTKYNLRKGEPKGYAYPPPFQPASFDLVIADAHPLHTREFNARVPHVLLVTQLIIAINAVKEGGTIFIKLSKPASFTTASVLYLMDSICSSLETIKPRTVHRNRGTFYTIARGVQRGEVLKGYLDVLHQMRRDLLNSVLDSGSVPSVYERITTLARLKECYIPRLIELGTPVWEVQREHLAWFIRNKGSAGSAGAGSKGENDTEAEY
ncbi:hypothetical protein M407DRAFT_225086 [Tulasnella calospora MUT 4182]|uniref:Ribosomal RNA methyltransferase FtsJ domain-containing protein n=1 Tax=Tulasnella calospora MUT 4182 TaxID=1051891 RepID=A0A0C3QPK9_9AGAM|nr:hypothetical protein M407DRAFT_225086 [Tulasnella calospora MUT 4182]